MTEYEVTMRGFFEVPIAEHNIGVITFEFKCVVEGANPIQVISTAQDKLVHSFSDGLGYTHPELEELIIKPHTE